MYLHVQNLKTATNYHTENSWTLSSDNASVCGSHYCEWMCPYYLWNILHLLGLHIFKGTERKCHNEKI